MNRGHAQPACGSIGLRRHFPICNPDISNGVLAASHQSARGRWRLQWERCRGRGIIRSRASAPICTAVAPNEYGRQSRKRRRKRPRPQLTPRRPGLNRRAQAGTRQGDHL